MKTLTATLGYTAAALTLVVAVLVPFLLLGKFTKVFAGMGLHVDEMYTGGPKVRTIEAGNYAIVVHRLVAPHMLQNEQPFVQLDWAPVSALPQHVSDTVDVDGDGRPDVRISFDVPQDAKAPLRANLESLNPRYESRNNLGKQKYSALIVRVDNAILVRVPVAKP